MLDENTPLRDSTRDRILDATQALLADGGNAAVRMADIAKAAGISRQALYLHFPNRVDLLLGSLQQEDARYGIQDKLAQSRAASGGLARMDAWIEGWGNFIPHIYGPAKALLALRDTDETARKAWNSRMQMVRDGCSAALAALAADGALTPKLSATEATDILWSLLSLRLWESLRMDCGWSQDRYVDAVKQMARKSLTEHG